MRISASFTKGKNIFLLLVIAVLPWIAGCASTTGQLKQADRVVARIIEEKQVAALGRKEPFTIETPEQTLRSRLIFSQDLPVSDPISSGSGKQEKEVPSSQDQDKQQQGNNALAGPTGNTPVPLRLTLLDALQIAAHNSREYQTAKENVFRSALALDLERDAFRSTFAGMLSGEIDTDLSGTDTVTEAVNSGEISWGRRFKSGVEFAARIGLDLVKLLTSDQPSSLGQFVDVSLTIPLLRAAGRDIVAEPLTQAEREVVYAIWDFERFKRVFAVGIAADYLTVLQLSDQVTNARENYRSLVASARRARRLADAGRLPEIQVDQAAQDELRARNRWISAKQAFQSSLDSFKVSLGLPPDAAVELDHKELERLTEAIQHVFIKESGLQDNDVKPVPADSPIVLKETSMEDAGPYELEHSRAISIGLKHRLDLNVAVGRVHDARRAVKFAADGLGPDLNLVGTGFAGERRTSGSSGLPDAEIRPGEGNYSALLSLDLPLERTAERNALRESYIDLAAAVRDLQEQEDQAKLAIQDGLRDLIEFREGIRIQALSVQIARRRVESTDLFLRAGRAEIRDLLESQEALVSAQNGLTTALVNYRVAELKLQRDMGVLEVNEEGLWKEFQPTATDNDEQKNDQRR